MAIHVGNRPTGIPLAFKGSFPLGARFAQQGIVCRWRLLGGVLHRVYYPVEFGNEISNPIAVFCGKAIPFPALGALLEERGRRLLCGSGDLIANKEAARPDAILPLLLSECGCAHSGLARYRGKAHLCCLRVPVESVDSLDALGNLRLDLGLSTSTGCG